MNKREYRQLHLKDRKLIGSTAEFVGRMYGDEAISYIQTQAKKEGVSETHLCNRLFQEMLQKLINEGK